MDRSRRNFSKLSGILSLSCMVANPQTKCTPKSSSDGGDHPRETFDRFFLFHLPESQLFRLYSDLLLTSLLSQAYSFPRCSKHHPRRIPPRKICGYFCTLSSLFFSFRISTAGRVTNTRPFGEISPPPLDGFERPAFLGNVPHRLKIDPRSPKCNSIAIPFLPVFSALFVQKVRKRILLKNFSTT